MPRRIRSEAATRIEKDPFLKGARDRFAYCMEKWKDIRDQHDQDMRFLAGDQWDEKEKNKRKGRLPCVVVDMLSQYLHQVVNDVRQNKRAVGIVPRRSPANDKTASLRADWIRAIEYLSQAQTAYVTAADCMMGGSYGFCKLETFFEDATSWNMSVRILPIPNPNTIVYDPDCKHYDCSDAEDCFEIDYISHAKFKRDYPNAQIASFTDDIQQVAPDWVKSDQVQIASWWKVELTPIQLHLVDLGGGKTEPVVMRSDQLPDKFDRGRILKTRDHDDRRIVQYVLNGVECLQTNDPSKGKGWPGNWIPIIPFWGKEIFVDEGSGSVRKLFSLIRLARDPQRVVNYLASQEMMEAKMTPKTAYHGPTGMFSQNSKVWEEINEDPKAFAEWSQPEGFPPGSVKPERIPFVPNFQAYEQTMQAWERRIMTAMGISPLPVPAQAANEKSGIALEKIQGERSRGSFHFIDNVDRSIVFVGEQLNDVFEKIHTFARDIPARKEDGTHYIARINDKDNKKNQDYAGEHDVTVATVPSHDSQHEAAAAFAEVLANVPGVFPLIGDLIVKMRQYDIGPIAQQIAERLTPPQFAGQGADDDMPPTAKAVVAHAQQQVQQLQQVLKQLQQEKAAKMIEVEGKKWVAALQEKTKLIVAQATLNRASAETVLQSELDNVNNVLGMIHDHLQTAHEGEQDRATAAQEHQQAIEQASHAASLTPPPVPSQNGTQP